MQDIEETYNKYGEIVYKYVFCLTGNKDTIEEIVQETFLVAIKDIKKFTGKCKKLTLLCQMSKYIWKKAEILNEYENSANLLPASINIKTETKIQTVVDTIKDMPGISNINTNTNVNSYELFIKKCLGK